MKTTTFQWMVLRGLASIIFLLIKRGSPEWHGKVGQALVDQCEMLKDFELNEEMSVKGSELLAKRIMKQDKGEN